MFSWWIIRKENIKNPVLQPNCLQSDFTQGAIFLFEVVFLFVWVAMQWTGTRKIREILFIIHYIKSLHCWDNTAFTINNKKKNDMSILWRVQWERIFVDAWSYSSSQWRILTRAADMLPYLLSAVFCCSVFGVCVLLHKQMLIQLVRHWHTLGILRLS